MSKYIIRDWTGKILFWGKQFNSFDEGWEYIYLTDPNTQGEDSFYDDYFVEEDERIQGFVDVFG